MRSGGDGGMTRLQAPPPTQKLLAFYSGILKVDDAGKASVTFDLPDFNGTVRVMAMAWSKDGVGHASQDVFVRDPVVLTASIPRFLAVGDSSRLLVEINNVSGPAGDYQLSVATGEGISFPDEDATRTLTLAEKQRVTINVPIEGTSPGDFDVALDLTAPSGESYPTGLMLGVRPAGSPVTRRNYVAVAANGKLSVDGASTAEFVPGTASVSVSLGGAGPLDVAGILAALDRYPYGCVEQITSRAMPLVYLDDVAASVGIAADAAVRERVQKAVAGVLADQSASGAFGLWGPQDAGGDLWLDSYVTDFLTRAAEKGYDVPDVARRIALDNLANAIAYASDFEKGGEDVAYALYVLARTGRAAIGDLRYYADSKLDAFATPLAKAQLGAAMALYGDRARASRAFTAAMADLDRAEVSRGWRSDYGTSLRDGAAVLTLAAETEPEGVDIRTLATRIATMERAKRYTSTQENSWMLLAAAALIKDSAKTDFSIDGETIAAPLFRRFDGERLADNPVVIANLGDQPLDAVVASTGVPTTPDPAGGNGYTIERTIYTPEGDLAELSTVGQNDRFVVALTVTAEHADGGRLLVVDPIPAGFEIENPDISASGDTTTYDWLETNVAEHTEARTDRFVAAFDRKDDDALSFTVAYTDAGGVAGHVRPSGGDGGGHVPAGVQRPHRHRLGRSGRRDALGRESRAMALAPNQHRSSPRKRGPKGCPRWLLAAGGGSAVVAVAAVVAGTLLYRHIEASLPPLPDPASIADLDAGGRPRRQAAPALHHRRRALAAAGDHRRRRSEIPEDADRLRGPALLRAWRRRPAAILRAAGQFVLAGGHIVSGASTLTMQVARLIDGDSTRSITGQAPPDGARREARGAFLQGRDPEPLPRARSLWRQHRGRPRRQPRLFRQGAEAADHGRSGAAGRAAAVAGMARGRTATPRPPARRATACSTGWSPRR